jgi:hypothetical protein
VSAALTADGALVRPRPPAEAELRPRGAVGFAAGGIVVSVAYVRRARPGNSADNGVSDEEAFVDALVVNLKDGQARLRLAKPCLSESMDRTPARVDASRRKK